MQHASLWEFANLPIPRTRQHRPKLRRVICPATGDSNLEDSVHDKEGLDHAPEFEEVVKDGPAHHLEETELGHNNVRSVKHSELRDTPLSCGVESATMNFELPAPPAAARNLVEQAQFAHLCSIMSNKHHRRAGYPFGSLVDFVSDGSRFPILRLSSLAVPIRNVLENPKCLVVVQMPGWSGLANAQVTIFGDIYLFPPRLEDFAKQLFHNRNSKGDEILSGNSLYFRMHEIKDIFFVGGFGTVQWIDVWEYRNTQPDEIIATCSSTNLQVLSQQFEGDLRRVLSRNGPVNEVQLISLDANGADIRTRTDDEYGVVRLGFQDEVRTFEEAEQAFHNLLK